MAARRLGITRTAVYNRINRGTLKSQTDNHGHQLVNIADTVSRDTLRHVTPDTVTPTLNPGRPTEPRQTAQGAPDAVPMSLYLLEIERIQAALQAQIDQLRADAIEERQRHVAEIERLVGQVHAERSFWIERADQAEVRAEAAEARLHERRLPAPDLALPWWRRWFGASTRSNLKG